MDYKDEYYLRFGFHPDIPVMVRPKVVTVHSPGHYGFEYNEIILEPVDVLRQQEKIDIEKENKQMQTKPKYIKDAIMWNGYDCVWVRTSDLNYIQEGDYYTPAIHPHGTYIIKQAYPYQEWMEEYIGTNNNLLEDERLRRL